MFLVNLHHVSNNSLNVKTVPRLGVLLILALIMCDAASVYDTSNIMTVYDRVCGEACLLLSPVTVSSSVITVFAFSCSLTCSPFCLLLLIADKTASSEETDNRNWSALLYSVREIKLWYVQIFIMQFTMLLFSIHEIKCAVRKQIHYIVQKSLWCYTMFVKPK